MPGKPIGRFSFGTESAYDRYASDLAWDALQKARGETFTPEEAAHNAKVTADDKAAFRKKLSDRGMAAADIDTIDADIATKMEALANKAFAEGEGKGYCINKDNKLVFGADKKSKYTLSDEVRTTGFEELKAKANPILKASATPAKPAAAPKAAAAPKGKASDFTAAEELKEAHANLFEFTAEHTYGAERKSADDIARADQLKHAPAQLKANFIKKLENAGVSNADATKQADALIARAQKFGKDAYRIDNVNYQRASDLGIQQDFLTLKGQLPKRTDAQKAQDLVAEKNLGHQQQSLDAQRARLAEQEKANNAKGAELTKTRNDKFGGDITKAVADPEYKKASDAYAKRGAALDAHERVLDGAQERLTNKKLAFEVTTERTVTVPTTPRPTNYNPLTYIKNKAKEVASGFLQKSINKDEAALAPKMQAAKAERARLEEEVKTKYNGDYTAAKANPDFEARRIANQVVRESLNKEEFKIQQRQQELNNWKVNHEANTGRAQPIKNVTTPAVAAKTPKVGQTLGTKAEANIKAAYEDFANKVMNEGIRADPNAPGAPYTSPENLKAASANTATAKTNLLNALTKQGKMSPQQASNTIAAAEKSIHAHAAEIVKNNQIESTGGGVKDGKHTFTYTVKDKAAHTKALNDGFTAVKADVIAGQPPRNIFQRAYDRFTGNSAATAAATPKPAAAGRTLGTKAEGKIKAAYEEYADKVTREAFVSEPKHGLTYTADQIKAAEAEATKAKAKLVKTLTDAKLTSKEAADAVAKVETKFKDFGKKSAVAKEFTKDVGGNYHPGNAGDHTALIKNSFGDLKTDVTTTLAGKPQANWFQRTIAKITGDDKATATPKVKVQMADVSKAHDEFFHDAKKLAIDPKTPQPALPTKRAAFVKSLTDQGLDPQLAEAAAKKVEANAAAVQKKVSAKKSVDQLAADSYAEVKKSVEPKLPGNEKPGLMQKLFGPSPVKQQAAAFKAEAEAIATQKAALVAERGSLTVEQIARSQAKDRLNEDKKQLDEEDARIKKALAKNPKKPEKLVLEGDRAKLNQKLAEHDQKLTDYNQKSQMLDAKINAHDDKERELSKRETKLAADKKADPKAAALADQPVKQSYGERISDWWSSNKPGSPVKKLVQEGTEIAEQRTALAKEEAESQSMLRRIEASKKEIDKSIHEIDTKKIPHNEAELRRVDGELKGVERKLKTVEAKITPATGTAPTGTDLADLQKQQTTLTQEKVKLEAEQTKLTKLKTELPQQRVELYFVLEVNIIHYI